jgi:hypothetical protein
MTVRLSSAHQVRHHVRRMAAVEEPGGRIDLAPVSFARPIQDWLDRWAPSTVAPPPVVARRLVRLKDFIELGLPARREPTVPQA